MAYFGTEKRLDKSHRFAFHRCSRYLFVDLSLKPMIIDFVLADLISVKKEIQSFFLFSFFRISKQKNDIHMYASDVKAIIYFIKIDIIVPC